MKIFIPPLLISRHSLLSERLEQAKTEGERRLANASLCKDSFSSGCNSRSCLAWYLLRCEKVCIGLNLLLHVFLNTLASSTVQSSICVQTRTLFSDLPLYFSVHVDANDRLARLRQILHDLPPHNLAVVKRIMFHLNRYVALIRKSQLLQLTVEF